MKIKLINKDEHLVEFIIKEKKTKEGFRKMILKTSKSDSWTDSAKNKKHVEIIEIGDDYLIKMSSRPDIILDASELNELQLLLNNFVLETDNFSPEYERVIKNS
jgi:hypothetical protein